MGIAATGGGVSRYDVAVVEPDARNRMRLGTHLAGAAQFESIDELVQHLRPGRLVVAVFGPDARGAVRLPAGAAPHRRRTRSSARCFAVDEVTADMLQAAIRAGARDTVALNDAVALDQAVGRVGELLQRRRRRRVPAVADTRPSPGRLIVVFSTKGGVGKSTIAINVARRRSRARRPSASRSSTPTSSSATSR